MINDRFAELMARHLSGETSEEETKEFEILLKEDPQAHYFYHIFSSYWTVDPQKTVNELQEEIHFQQIIAIAEKERTEPLVGEEIISEVRSHWIITLKRLLVAAVLSGIMLTSYFLIFHRKNSPSKEIAVNEIEAKKGARSFMLLPDGTKVWLNS